MGAYEGGWVKKMIETQSPMKYLLRKVGLHSLSPNDATILIELLKCIMELPKLEASKMGNKNTDILIGIYRDAKIHFSSEFLRDYEEILDALVNFFTTKYDYDGFYNGLGDWFLGEMVRRGWVFPNQNRPHSTLWNTIPPDTKARLKQSIMSNYNLLIDRLMVIEEKLGNHSEGEVHMNSRREQFVNRILTDFEREVEAWKR